MHIRIDHTVAKLITLINMLARTAKLQWGLGNKALKTIYERAVVPILMYRAPMWVEATGSGRKNSPIWEGHSFGWGAHRRTAVYVTFSVYIMACSGEHRAFVVEFIKNGRSPVAIQRAFRIRFAPGLRDTVPDKTIYRWVSDFRQTGSALKQTSPGRPRTGTGPENVAAVRASILKSPRRSARKHAAALRLSDRSVRRILHRDLRMHPYKIAIAQKLKGSYFENRTNMLFAW